MRFPIRRMRRLRRTRGLREMVAETRLHLADFIYPIFVSESISEPEPIDSMPGINRHSLDSATRESKRVFDLGIPAVLLFGSPKTKDATGSASLCKDTSPEAPCPGTRRRVRAPDPPRGHLRDAWQS